MFLLEVGLVGLLVLIIGLIVSYSIMYLEAPEQLDNFKHWGSIGVSFALTGMLVHVLCEYTGLNKLYCRYGNACQVH